MSDFSIYKSLKLAAIASNDQFTPNTGAASAIAQSCTRERSIALANLSASTAEGVGGGVRVPYAAQLKVVTITGNLAAVANATDYSTVNVFKRTGNGAAVLMATANLSNTAVVKLVPIAATLVSNGANTTLAAGDVITCNNALTGNGTANNMQVFVDFTFEDV